MATAAKRLLCSVNRQLRRFDDRLFILGEGRSGTTWIMNLLNFDDRYRCLVEPFLTQNFQCSVDYLSEYPFPDRVGKTDVARQISRTLRGDYISANATPRFPRLLYDGLLIKDVSAHLILDQIDAAAPEMKKILILRHPFAVASSKVQTFSWPTRPSAFLSDANPRRAVLAPQRALIQATERDNDPLLVQVLLWCIAFRFAFAASAIRNFVLLFYEDLARNPHHEIGRLYVELDLADRYEAHRREIEAVIDVRSHVTRSRNTIQDSKAGHAAWLKNWPTATINAGLKILREFDLDFLYGDRHEPLLDGAALGMRVRTQGPTKG